MSTATSLVHSRRPSRPILWLALALLVPMTSFAETEDPQPAALGKSFGRMVQGTSTYPLQFSEPVRLEVNSETVQGAPVIHGGHAYYLASNSKSRLVKVDLETFQRVGALELDETLNLGLRLFTTLFLAGDHAYFVADEAGSDLWLLVKVDLVAFRITETLTLPSGDFQFGRSLVLGDFAYLFGSSARQCIRIDLQNFQIAGVLDLSAFAFHSMWPMTDDQSVYVAVGEIPIQLLRIDPQGFTLAEAVSFGEGTNSSLQGAFLSAGFAYLTLQGSPNQIVKIDLASLETVATLQVPQSPSHALKGGVVDGDRAYLSTYSEILELDLNQFSISRQLNLEAGFEEGIRTLNLAGDRIHAVTGESLSTIVQVDRSSFTVAGKLDFLQHDLFVGTPLQKDGFAYLPLSGANPRLLKIDLEQRQKVGTVMLEGTDRFLEGALLEGDFAYLLTGSPTRIVKVDLNGFQQVAVPPLAEGLGQLRALGARGGQGYFYSSEPARRILQLDLNTLTETGRIELGPGQSPVTDVDFAGVFGYFSQSGANADLLKVRLQNFSRVGTLRLHKGSAAFSDILVAGSFAYASVSPAQTAARIVKLDLRTFKRVGEIVLKPSEESLTTALQVGRYAYFTTSGPENRLIRVDLQGFKRVQEPEVKFLAFDFARVSRLFAWGSTLFVSVTGDPSYDPFGSVRSIDLGSQAGVIKATKVVLGRKVRPRAVSFRAHAAGPIRLALYDAGKRLLWQSGIRNVNKPNSLVTIALPAGTPDLPKGTYYLAWQVDSEKPIPSLSMGANGSGWKLPWAWGEFPVQIEGELATRENWTQFLNE